MKSAIEILFHKDQVEMIHAATRRANEAHQAIIDGLIGEPASERETIERTLALAALARIVRARVERAATASSHLDAMLPALDLYIDRVLEVSEWTR